MFVHGIRAEGAGTSTAFAKHLAEAIEAPPPGPAMPHLLNLGPRHTATMLSDYAGTGPFDTQIWRSDPEWEASRPFVNRTNIAGKLQSVVIDEHNYWPLLFPIKCRFLLVPEHDLSGNDAVHLTLCKDSGWITGQARSFGSMMSKASNVRFSLEADLRRCIHERRLRPKLRRSERLTGLAGAAGPLT